MNGSTPTETGHDLRVSFGTWLTQLRKSKRLTQKALAEQLGEYPPVFISQVETGRLRIPDRLVPKYCACLEQEPQIFVKEVLRHYEPDIFDLLYGS